MGVTPADVVVRGATVLDERGTRRADVRIVGARVVEVASALEPSARAIELDGSGAYVMPAFVDLHTHLREPGQEAAETVVSGSRAAVIGGFRAVVAMPNTVPAIDSTETVRAVRLAAKDALCEVVVSGAITVGRAGERLAPLAELAALGVRMFTDDGAGVQDESLMREALVLASSLSVLIAQHCEQASYAKGGHMHEGAWSSRLGISGQDPRSEDAMVERDLRLVAETGAREHFLHLSTASAIERVRRAKAAGLPVSAEATPHHLSLSDGVVVGYDPVFKVNPPLRPTSDVAAVRAGLRDGTIDAIATDHAPHAPETKERTFDCAPFGMIGLETAFSVAYTELVAGEHLAVSEGAGAPLSMADLVRLFAGAPARIAGLAGKEPLQIAPGSPADLVVFDPTTRWRYVAARGKSRSINSPFDGCDLVGRVRHTIVAGEPVVVDAAVQR